MSSSNFDGAATPATPEPKPACEAAPLPPQAGYIDEDGTFYPGFEGDDQSDCSDVASSVDVGPSCAAGDDDDDAVFAEKILQASPQPSAARTTSTRRPAARRAAGRPDIYSLRVMPAECYQYIAPPPVAVFQEEPMTEAAPGDVGDALIDDVSGHDALSTGAYGAYPPYRHDAEDDFYNAAPAAAAASPQQPRPSRRNASTSAQPAGTSGVMCCYFKQGHCHMGDQCWYAHEGAESTPCHYGAKCRKGHRNLVRSNAVPPVPKDAATRAAAPTAAPTAAVPKRYVHEPKAKQSAPLRDSDMACPHCSESGKVRLQDFPLFEGSRVRQATRGHCGECLRTFMLA